MQLLVISFISLVTTATVYSGLNPAAPQSQVVPAVASQIESTATSDSGGCGCPTCCALIAQTTLEVESDYMPADNLDPLPYAELR